MGWDYAPVMPIAPEYLHLVHQGPFPCYLYGRNSRDPKKKGRSVGDQLHEGNGLADRFNWPVAGIFKDTGISATRHAKKRRDEFEEMLEGIRARKVRLVVAYEASRYYRDLEVYVRLRNACAEANVLLCYNGMVYDLSTSADRKATAQDALQAESEGDAIRDRNLRTARINAERGRPHGRVLDGYIRLYDPRTGDLVDQIEDPERGFLITRVFAEYAAGIGKSGVAKRFNRDGFLTQNGRPWQRHHVDRILNTPSYMGRRFLNGVEVGDAIWPALTDEATYGLCQEIQATKERCGPTSGETVQHLLSGTVALCGLHPELADRNMEPGLESFNNRGTMSMRCQQDGPHVVITEANFVAFVEEAVTRYLSSPEAVEVFRPAETGAAQEAEARLERLTAQLEEARVAAATFRPDGTPMLSIASLAAMEARLTPMIEEAKQKAAPEAAVPKELRDLLGRPIGKVQAGWSALTVPQQRLVLRKAVTIRLYKAGGPGVRRIHPGRVTLAFKGQPGFMGGQPRGRALPEVPGQRLPGAS
ncbi:recombinase family protein [Streptomyces sp. NPDC127051]|uniref:recombinase family protein n=1 Tax=Streptomyces sp. NPDC127051 TaxID=3347119 RepID=UPI003666695E